MATTKVSKSEFYLLEVERRFKNVSGIREDLSKYPMHQSLATSVETNKSKSKEFGEVFTPLWLCDQMIDQSSITAKTSTLDLCAGYGQFSIRLLRKLYNKNNAFNCIDFINNKHSFSELQLESCYKILYTFSTSINLFIGDARELPSLPGIATGIWVFVEKMNGWVPLTETVKNLMYPFLPENKTPISSEEFVKQLSEIITDLNKAFTMNTEEYNKLTKDTNYNSHNRLDVLRMINNGMNIGQLESSKYINTPTKLINNMLACTDDLEKKQILVLFNAEIVEELIHSKNVPAANITFGVEEQNQFRATFVNETYNVHCIVFPNNDGKSIVQSLGKKQWDLGLSNPPYTRGLDLKILQALLDNSVAKEYIIVHPSTWLLDQKNKKPQYILFKSTLANKLKSIDLFNGNDVFNIGLFVPCAITHIDINHDSENINVKYFAKEFQVDSIHDITNFGNEWKSIVKPFFTKITAVVANNGDVWSHNEKVVDASKSYCQLACIIGNHSKDKNILVKDDFYTMTIRNSSCNKGIRESRLNKPGGHTPTFGFNSEVERDNFLSYLNTDFARFCLALYKIGQHLENGELEIIPWIDFTKSWDDEKLFAYFEVNQETQNYIRSFLPDYYGIRNNQTNFGGNMPEGKSKSHKTMKKDCSQTIKRMTKNAKAAVAQSGKKVSHTLKSKEIRFSDDEHTHYLKELWEVQNGLCAITGIQLQLDEIYTDEHLIASEDRIASDGHYEPGNVQLVCRFINRWKGDLDNDVFKRLINIVRLIDAPIVPSGN